MVAMRSGFLIAIRAVDVVGAVVMHGFVTTAWMCRHALDNQQRSSRKSPRTPMHERKTNALAFNGHSIEATKYN